MQGIPGGSEKDKWDQLKYFKISKVLGKPNAREAALKDVMRALQKKEVRQENLLEAVKARLKRRNSWRVEGENNQ